MGIHDVRPDGSFHLAYAKSALKFLVELTTKLDAGETVGLITMYAEVKTGDDDVNCLLFEFMKDFGCAFDATQVRAMVGGDHALLWRYVNADLKRFGHPEVDPVPLEE